MYIQVYCESSVKYELFGESVIHVISNKIKCCILKVLLCRVNEQNFVY